MRFNLIAASMAAASLVLAAGATVAARNEAGAVQPAGNGALSNDPRLLVGMLDNGVRYIITKHSNPPNRGLIWMHVNTGTLNETPKQRGAARLIQRMAFTGSKNFANSAAVGTLLQSIGSQPNIDALSHSTFEETVFKLALRESTPDAIDKALSYLADIPTTLTFPDIEFEQQRNTLIDQIKAISTPDTRVQDIIWKQFAPGSLFGDRIPNAPEAAFKALTKADCLAYYQQWYAPSNVTVIVAVDSDPAAALEVVKAKLGVLPKVPRPTPVDVGMKPYEKPFSILAVESELKQTQLYMFRLAPPHPPTRTESDLRAKLVQSLAIGAFNRRLNEKMSGGKVKFVSGSALAVDVANACTLLAVNASADLKDWKTTLASLGEETQRARLHGLPASDIEATKKQYLQASEQGIKQDSSKVVGTLVGGIASSVNNGDVYMAPEQTLAVLNKLLPTITKDELDQAFKRMFDPATAAFVMATPGGEGTPSESELVKAGSDAFVVTPSAEGDVTKPTTLLAKTPTPGKVASETTHEKTNVQTWTLDNGAVVHFRNMAEKKDTVNITIGFAGGLIQETPENHGVTEAGAVVLDRPATSTLTSSTIVELLQGKSVEVRGSAGVDAVVLGVSGSVKDIESGMQLAHVLLSDPFIEPPTFDQWRRNALDQAKEAGTKPQSAFNSAVHDTLFPEDEFRLRPLTEKEASAITVDGAVRWIKQLFATGPMEVSVVGDITKEEAQRLVLTYIGSLPKRAEPTADLFKAAREMKRPSGTRFVEREIDSPMQTAYLMLGFYAADESASMDRRALFMARAILEPRLVRSLRDQEKIVSGLQIRFDPGQEFPGFGMFRAMAPMAIEKLDVVVKRLEDTFKSFAEVGPTPEEMEGVRKQALQSLESVQKDPNYWTGELSTLRLSGKSLDEAAGERAAYESITAADVKASFAKYYGTGTNLKVVLKPKPAAPAAAPEGSATEKK